MRLWGATPPDNPAGWLYRTAKNRLVDSLRHEQVLRRRRHLIARPEAIELFHAAPGGVRTTEAFSSSNRWESLDTDAEAGCIRSVEHPYTGDGGLAVTIG